MKTKLCLSIAAFVALMMGIPVAFFMFNWNYLAPNEPVTLEQRVIVPEGHKVHENTDSWRDSVSTWAMHPTYDYEGTAFGEYQNLISKYQVDDSHVVISGITTVYGSRIPGDNTGGWIRAIIHQDVRGARIFADLKHSTEWVVTPHEVGSQWVRENTFERSLFLAGVLPVLLGIIFVSLFFFLRIPERITRFWKRREFLRTQLA